jgi:NhaP-type Na+/H+ or K+/H+ antiporter
MDHGDAFALNDILLLGLIILVGFIGRGIFRYTKVPEALFMIIIGLAVGPLFGIIDQSVFITYTPIVISLTLIIVLLDSGLSINIFDMARRLGKAIVFTILVLVFSTLIIGGFMYLIGWEPLHAFLIGVVSSGSTTIVVTSLLVRLSVPEEIKQILIMESIINDVTLVTSAIVLIQIIKLGALDTIGILSVILEPIIISILVGIFFTILWVNVIEWFYKGEELIYCFTLGILFLLYSFVELINGNGAIAILVLSLSLGNLPIIFDKIGESRFFKQYPKTLKKMSKRTKDVVKEIKRTQVDFAFFIKIFFFVYLGIIFDLTKLTPSLLGLSIVILFLMFISRYISSRILALADSNFKKYSTIISSMVARGFTATFVALLPTTMGVEIPQLKELILIMVLVSTITTIVASIIFERRTNEE